MRDVIDASVALLASASDVVLTSDPDDLTHFVKTVGNGAMVVRC